MEEVVDWVVVQCFKAFSSLEKLWKTDNIAADEILWNWRTSPNVCDFWFFVKIGKCNEATGEGRWRAAISWVMFFKMMQLISGKRLLGEETCAGSIVPNT